MLKNIGINAWHFLIYLSENISIFFEKRNVSFDFFGRTINSNKNIFNDARIIRNINWYSLRNVFHVSLHVSIMHGKGDFIPLKVSIYGEIHLNGPKTIRARKKVWSLVIYSPRSFSQIHNFQMASLEGCKRSNGSVLVKRKTTQTSLRY